MAPFARWLLLVVVAAPAGASGQSLGLKLRFDPLLTPPAEDAAGQGTTFIEADQMSGRQGEEVEAHGNAKLRTRGRTLFCDHLHYDVKTEKVEATGRIRLDQQGDILKGSRMELDLPRDSGYVDQPDYYFRQLNARGRADRLYLDSKRKFRAVQATYSTCQAPEDDWYLKVRRLSIDREKNEGVARHATVYFKDVPILYSPYIDFPLSKERKSGFLPPTYGTTGKSGFEVLVPFYANLAPNYDATISPRVLAKRGLMVNNEFRYLDPKFRGTMLLDYLPSDRQLGGTSRYSANLQHTQSFTDRITGYLTLQKASDDQFFVDLSSRLATTTITNLPREGGLSYNGGWWSLTGRTQRYQTLQDPRAPIAVPYARLPQITFTADRRDIRGFDTALASEFVDFSHPTQLNGRRFMLYPSLAYPLQTSFASVVPKLGLHYTQYQLDPFPGYSNTSRSLPIFSLDSTVTLERSTAFLGRPLTQTLEPRLYYVYIPYHDQSRLPVFDTGVSDLNIAQIFSENQFSGVDRINDANQLTGAVTSRFIDPIDGRERLRVLLAQRFFFNEQRVTLPGSAIRTRDQSDVLASATGRLDTAWYADAAMRFNVNDGRPDLSNFVLRYTPEPMRVINAGYRFSRTSFEQTDVSSQWRFSDRWAGVGRWIYSLRDRRSTTTIGGLEYNAGCWVGRFVFQQVVAFNQVNVRALYFQIELNGLSSLGSDPLDVLKQNVLGYQKINSPSLTPFNDYYPAQ